MPIPAIAAIAGRAGTVGVAEAAGSSLAKQGAKSLLDAGIGGKDFGKSTEIFTKSAKAATQETKAVASAFDTFRNSARRATIDFYIAKAALSGLSQKAIDLLTTPLDMLVDAAKPIQNLVSLNSPALAERFTLVMRDAYAVIGRMLIPAMQVMTQLMRRLGDAYAKMEPILQPTIDAFSRMASQIGNQLLSSLEKSGPLIAGIAVSFELLATALQPVGPIIGLIVDMSTGLLQLIGRLSGRKPNPNASSMGAAVRNVGIGTSGEDISRQAQAKALSQIVNEPEKKTQEDVPTILDDILKFLKQNLSIDTIKAVISALIPNAKDIPGGETIASGSDTIPMLQYFRSLLTR